MKLIILQLLLGLGIGYLVSSILEAFLHKNIQHAKKRVRLFWAKQQYIGEAFLNAYFSHHVIHHGRTFKKNFVTQFRDKDEKARLDSHLDTKGEFGDLIKKERYGVSLYGRGLLKFNLPMIPFAIIIFVIGGKWIFIGSIPTLMAYWMMSMFVHPYIHLPYQQALDEAPYIISRFFKTKYMRAVIRNHYMHHKYPDNNFNLILGGDYILGYHRDASAEDIEAMKALGIPVN